MEFIDGRPLTKMISTNGIESGELIKKIILEIIAALDYVHKKQIFHRDLKPDNIMVTYKGDNVKLIDFGLALTDSFPDNLKMAGTPKYAAPEQLIAGQTVDATADIYSLGLIITEMLTGSITNSEAVAVRSGLLLPVIQKCIHPNKNLRYQNVLSLFNDINNITIQDKLNISYIINSGESDNKIQTEIIKPVIEDVAVQNIYQFFKKSWDYLTTQKNSTTNTDTPKNPFELLLKTCDTHFFKVFENTLALQGEYLIFHDPLHTLTNLRVFLRNHSQNSYQQFLLSDLENEKCIPIDYLYCSIKGYKIWQTVWDKISEAIKLQVYSNFPEETRKIVQFPKEEQISTFKTQFNLPDVQNYCFSAESIPFSPMNEFIAYSEKIWESDKFLPVYDYKYQNHTQKIKIQLQAIQLQNNHVFWLKTEYLIAESVFEAGVLTNLRFTGSNLSGEQIIIPLIEIAEIAPFSAGVLATQKGILIGLKNNTSIKTLAQNGLIQNQNEMHEKLKRLNAIIKLLQPEKMTVTPNLIVLNKQEVLKMYNLNG